MIKKIFLVSFALLFTSLFSCSKGNKSLVPYDTEAGLSRSKFEKVMVDPHAREKMYPDTVKEQKLPDLSQVLSPPQKPKVAEGKLVSLTVTEDIPVRDVLIELSRLSDIEMEIDPFIGGGIILIVKDRPFIEVIERICDLADLRYSVRKGLLKVERDLPYVVNYSVPYLDITRGYTAAVSVSTVTGSASSSEGSSGETISSGSENALDVSSEENLWNSIILDTAQLIGDEAETEGSSEYVTANQRAGILTVSTTQKKHKVIKTYLDEVKRHAFAQVLIEAKIVEVNLSDEYQSGINWTEVNKINGSGNLTSNVSNSTNVFSLVLRQKRDGGTDLDGTLQVIESFGTTRTLSSPRLTALNNQQAILTFTENKVYFEVEYDSTTTSSTSTTTETSISSTIKSVPIGIILALQPSIDTNKQEILMNIRPTISSSPSVESDPAVALIAAKESVSITSEIPVIKLQELDTLLRVRSGEVMVIGGLIEQSHDNQESGIPILKSIPLLGYLFKSKAKAVSLKETVIFIKATIIDPSDDVDILDKNFYKTFTNDPKPLNF